MKQEMSVQDVIKNSHEIKNMRLDWEQMYKIIYVALMTKKYRAIRNGNTVFIIKITAPHEANLMVFNAEDSFKTYMRNIMEFSKAMDIAGYKKVSVRGVNRQVINIMKHAGYNIEAEPIGRTGKLFSVVATKGG